MKKETACFENLKILSFKKNKKLIEKKNYKHIKSCKKNKKVWSESNLLGTPGNAKSWKKYKTETKWKRVLEAYHQLDLEVDSLKDGQDLSSELKEHKWQKWESCGDLKKFQLALRLWSLFYFSVLSLSSAGFLFFHCFSFYSSMNCFLFFIFYKLQLNIVIVVFFI